MSGANTETTVPNTPHRPLSPHLEIWRWHITMAASILHRASGVAFIAALLMVVAWIACTALGPQAYTVYISLAASPLGMVVWVGASLAGFIHMFGGLRHLIWDLGASLEPKTASNLTWLSLIAAIITTVGFWAWLILTHHVSL